jgi:hypothetical protein
LPVDAGSLGREPHELFGVGALVAQVEIVRDRLIAGDDAGGEHPAGVDPARRQVGNRFQLVAPPRRIVGGL